MSAVLFPSPDEILRFRQALSGSASDWDIQYTPQTASTNELAARAARAGAGHGTVFAADEQTAGRGQRGRSWHSPSGKGLLFSVVVRGTGLTPDRMGWVALSAGLACIQGLQAFTTGDLRLKWPNDLVHMDPLAGHPPWRKLGGILVQSSLSANLKVDYTVIGVGVNAEHSASDFPADVRTPPTSLRILNGCSPSRPELLKAVLESLARQVSWITGSGDYVAMTADVRAAFSAWWQSWDLRVAANAAELNASYADLDAHGRLYLTVPPQRRPRMFPQVEWLDASPSA